MRLRLLGAAMLLMGGAMHSSLAFDGYGTRALVEMFFLNGIASAAIAAVIAIGRGWSGAMAGIGISATSLLAFALSRVGNGVLGFRGNGLDPAPEALLTLMFELVALALLSALVLERRDEILRTLKAAAAGHDSH